MYTKLAFLFAAKIITSNMVEKGQLCISPTDKLPFFIFHKEPVYNICIENQ